MNKHPSSQLLRFLKAYYKITNKNITDINHFKHKVWLDCLKDNKFITVPTQEDSVELIIVNLPNKPVCKAPSKNIDNIITGDFCDPEISNVDLLKSVNLCEHNDSNFDRGLENEINEYLSLRSIWLNDYIQYQLAFNLYNELQNLYLLYQNSSHMSLFLGNGLLQLDKDDTNICFPLIHQPVIIIKDTNCFKINRISSAYLCTDTLTNIPGVSPSAIENSIEAFESKNIDLPEGEQLNTVLADIFKNITTGNKSLIRINNLPLLFLNPYSKPYSNIINNLLQHHKTNEATTSLDKFLCSDITKLNKAGNKDINFNDFCLLNNDKTSANIINTLDNDHLCLVQAPAGTDYFKIVANTVGHYLNLGKNILVIEPSQKHLDSLKENVPKKITTDINTKNNDTNDLVEQKNNLLSQYLKLYNGLEGIFSKIKNSTDNDPNTYYDNNQLYWSEDAVYRRGLLTEVLNKTESLLNDNFTKFPFAKLIADQNKIDVLRDEWHKLIKLIDDYRLLSNNTTKTLYKFKVELNMLLNLNSALATVDEIIAYLRLKKKLRKIDYTFSRNWKNLITSCFINKKQPQTLNDFILIKMFIEKSILKNSLIRAWSKMLVPIGLPKLVSNDKDLDICLNKYYPIIIESINWYEESWKPFITDLLITGFRWKEFFNIYAQQYIENDLIDTLANYALKHLKELISERITYTQEDLLYPNSELESLNLIDSDKNIIDLNHHLSLINNLKVRIDSISDKILNNSNGGVVYKSYQQFLKDCSIPKADYYDLIIINNCENLDIFSVLALSFTEKCLVIGDEYQNYKEAYVTNLETINELGESLLSGFKNNFSIVNSSNLYEFLKGNCVPNYYLSNNIFNPLAIVNCLNKICYDDTLKYFGNQLADSMMSLNLTQLINNNSDNLVPYIFDLINELRSNITKEKSIAIVDIHEKYYFEINSIITKNGFNNIYVSNIDGIANLKFDIVIVLDLCDSYAKITKYDNTIRAELCTLLGSTKEFFCYIHNSSSINYLLPLQNELVDYIDNSRNDISGYSNSVINNLINQLKSYNLTYYKNILINNLEIDLVINTTKPIFIIDKRKIIGLKSNLSDTFLALNKNKASIFLVNFEEDADVIISKLTDLLDLESSNKQQNTINYFSILEHYNKNWHETNKLKAISNEIVYKKEVAVANDEDELKIIETNDNKLTISNKNLDTGSIKKDSVKPLTNIFNNSTNINYGFNDSDLNNKAALYNFSLYDNDLDESFGFVVNDSVDKKNTTSNNSVSESPVTNSDPNIKILKRTRVSDSTPKQDFLISPKSNIISDKTNTVTNKSATPVEQSFEEITAFDPDNDTYSNLYIKESKKTTELSKTDFNLINWLKENSYEYYDFRPEGKLYIIDIPKMRNILRGLRGKGYYFTLSLNNSQLPENKSAWILK